LSGTYGRKIVGAGYTARGWRSRAGSIVQKGRHGRIYRKITLILESTQLDIEFSDLTVKLWVDRSVISW